MDLFLLHATKEHHRSPAEMYAGLVDAEDEAAARATASPGSHPILWLEGVCAFLLGVDRGGNRP